LTKLIQQPSSSHNHRIKRLFGYKLQAGIVVE
jgi:hypothetical protein